MRLPTLLRRGPRAADSRTAAATRALADASPDPLVVLDAERRYVHVNAAAEWLLGWPAAGVRGRSVARVPLPFAGDFESLLRRALEAAPERPHVATHASGRRYEVRAVSLDDALALGFRELRDAGAHDLQVAAVESRYGALFESIPQAMIGFDLQRRVTRWNAAATQLFGWRAGELLGRTLPIVPAGVEDAADAAFERLLAEAPIAYETQRRRRDGALVDVSVSLAVMYDEEGARVGYLAIYTDITERRRADARLRESEERYRHLFEGHSAVMLLLDPATGEIVDANPAAVRFYGYPLETLRGMRITQINATAPDEVYAAMAQASAQRVNTFVFPHRLATGELRRVEVHSALVHAGGRTLLHSIVQDVSDRARLEEQLRRVRASELL